MSTVQQTQERPASHQSEQEGEESGAEQEAEEPGAEQPGGEPAEPDRSAEPDDRDFARLFKQGALVGTPLSFLLVGVLLLVAAPEPEVLLAALWAAIMGGWYFGAMAMLAIHELRQQGARLPLPRRLVRSVA